MQKALWLVEEADMAEEWEYEDHGDWNQMKEAQNILSHALGKYH